MRRTLLSTLIAGLFAVPAIAQTPRRSGSSKARPPSAPSSRTSTRSDASKAEQYRDLSDGALSSILLRGRGPAADWFDFYGENFGRDDMYISLRGGRYDVFKYRIYTDWLTQNRLFGGRTPFSGAGSGDLRAVFPQPDPSTWQLGRHRARPPRHRRLLRVAAQHAVVLPRRHQLRRARRHQDRLRRQRHEPGQRVHRSRDPDRLPDDQRLRRARLQHAEVPLRGELRGELVRQRVQDRHLEQPVLGQRRRHDAPRPGQHLPADRAQRHDPAAAAELHARRPLHLGPARERHVARDDGAQRRRASLAPPIRTSTRSTARSRTPRSRSRGPRTRSATSIRASTTRSRSARTIRRTSRSRRGRAWTAGRAVSAATIPTSTNAGTQASTPTGGSRAATGSAAGSSSSTSSRTARTTTRSRTRNSSPAVTGGT